MVTSRATQVTAEELIDAYLSEDDVPTDVLFNYYYDRPKKDIAEPTEDEPSED